MAVQGPMTWFDRANLKIGDGTILLGSHTFHALLLTSSQAISRSFVGSSGDCRYADLTGEFTTANGYTSGGVALTGASLTRATASEVAWTTSFASWTLSGSLASAKYFVLVDWTATNKDLVAFMDFDTGGGSVTLAPPTYANNPDPINGWLNWIQL